MKKIKLALVGIGGYGKTYLDYILDKNDDRIETVGLVEPYPESCGRLSAIREREIPVFPDYRALYKSAPVDLTVISSPIHCHTPQILAALENGSSVLCEKPLCADEKDIPRILEAKRKSGLPVHIGYQWSYSGAISALKADILSGKLGKCRSMKSIVLWPRDRAYYSRGSGWAGKIRLSDGTPVYDSIASNAAAHYLHNMLFLLGDYGRAAEPSDLQCELCRANAIENFDTAKISFTVGDGARALFLAAHPVKRNLEPTFELIFENAAVYYSAQRTNDNASLMPDAYAEYGKIVAIDKNGQKTVYGDPFANMYAKLDRAIRTVSGENLEAEPCGVEAAEVHTRLINRVAREFEIENFDNSLIRLDHNLVYVDGLYERMIGIYKDPAKSIKEQEP